MDRIQDGDNEIYLGDITPQVPTDTNPTICLKNEDEEKMIKIDNITPDQTQVDKKQDEDDTIVTKKQVIELIANSETLYHNKDSVDIYVYNKIVTIYDLPYVNDLIKFFNINTTEYPVQDPAAYTMDDYYDGVVSFAHKLSHHMMGFMKDNKLEIRKVRERIINHKLHRQKLKDDFFVLYHHLCKIMIESDM